MFNLKKVSTVLFLILMIGLLTVFTSLAGAICNDADLDGYGSPASMDCTFTTLDCDDTDSKVHPGAPRICDGKDSDCDGRADFLTDVDNDHDGVALCANDCNDNNANMFPGNEEAPLGAPICSDGLDNDCDGKIDALDTGCKSACKDNDGDGYGNPGSAFCPGGAALDCNDANANINPGETDATCNGVDDNCSGSADEGYAATATSCGIGACARTGMAQCQAGVVVNTCTPGAPVTEGPLGDPTCSDSEDNDCDNLTDALDPGCLTACVDSDGDGYGINGHATCPNAGIDCNDTNPDINPGMTDTNCNGVDEDCSGAADEGYAATVTSCGIGACARTGQNQCLAGVVVNTCVAGTPEIEGPAGNATCSDTIDNNCDGLTDAADLNCNSLDFDDDGDGYSENQADCNDNDNTMYPGAPKLCDGKDNNCDGRADTVTDVDMDGDGVPLCANDCNDNNANMFPGNEEAPLGAPICSDGLDNDCDGKIDALDTGCKSACKDNDGDGYGNPGSAFCPGGAALDCNDNNANINPGETDTTCNGIDENCSGAADEGHVATVTNCGVGACSRTGMNQCQAGVVVNTCTPGAPVTEGPLGDPTCSDSEDNDCDGSTDGVDPGCLTACVDSDGDGYGMNGHATCPNAGIDCNDTDPNINPGMTDTNCNGVDEDCSGAADEGYVITATSCGLGVCLSTGQNQCQSGAIVNTCTPVTPGIEGPPGNATCSDILDNDCDGLVDLADNNCDDPNYDKDGDGYSPNQGDCNDNDNTMYPGAPKLCDAKDNNCDGRSDMVTDVDNDHDGVPLCANDCNDNDAAMYPGNIEGPFGSPTCSDGKDNDCNKKVDAADPMCGSPCLDVDKDGYGANGNAACPNGTAIDCNDNNANINPGKTDTNCNGVDENCSGTADEGYATSPTSCGIGACAATGQLTCQAGAVVNTCTPGSPQTEGPLGDPTCSDTVDNDCDGSADIVDPGCLTACVDIDGDGYGANGHASCPNGAAIDCNDTNPNINPGKTDDDCNGVDDDCSGTADNGYVITITNCGIGACARTGLNQCQAGVVVDTCTAGFPDIEGPSGSPTCSDAIDNDCDGTIDNSDLSCNNPNIDDDGDGYSENQGDCDDTDPKVYPGALKICDGKDNNCDGRLDSSTDLDTDADGWAICAGDCNDNDALVNPGFTEGPFGNATCSDGKDNDCDNLTDSADSMCQAPTCSTKTYPKNGPHFTALLNPDNTTHPDSANLYCHKCHDPNNFLNEVKDQCQRCHSDAADTSDPLNGVLKTQYPLNLPYGFGSAPNVKLHSSTVVGAKYGNWNLKCITCHNPHTQEQDLRFGTDYGMLVKEYICLDNPVTGLNIEELIKFTAPTGQGSFADGPPHTENICEMCHTQTNHHRRDGNAPGDLDTSNNYTAHYDGVKCTQCHIHDEGFKPSCGACHDAPPPTGTHLKHFSGTKDDAEYGSTKITQDVTGAPGYLMNCGNCHPIESSRHINGVPNSGGGDAEIELYNPAAPAGSIKSLNPPTATYTPGGTVFTDSRGKKYTQGTCSNVYCHSGPETITSGVIPDPIPGAVPNLYPLTYDPPWQSFVVKSRQYQAPTWGVDSLGCNGCHGYPIMTQYPTVSAGAGESHAWIDDYGYLDLHAWNMGFDPLQCSTCHHETVQEDFLWVRDDFSIQLSDISIYNKAKHVNGAKDIVFTPVPVLYQKSAGDVYKDLSTATFNPATKNCSNVACHFDQTSVEWGTPYRWWKSFECNICHGRL